jgi:hypothetical protein
MALSSIAAFCTVVRKLRWRKQSCHFAQRGGAGLAAAVKLPAGAQSGLKKPGARNLSRGNLQ